MTRRGRASVPGREVVNDQVGRFTTGRDANWRPGDRAGRAPCRRPDVDDRTLALLGPKIVDRLSGPTRAHTGQSVLSGVVEPVPHTTLPKDPQNPRRRGAGPVAASLVAGAANTANREH